MKPTNQFATQFVNWKLIFIVFALASSAVPSDDRLSTYGNELAYYGSCITLENYVNVSKISNLFVFRLIHGSIQLRVLALKVKCLR